MLHVPSMEGLAVGLELALPRRDGSPEEVMGVGQLHRWHALPTENFPAFALRRIVVASEWVTFADRVTPHTPFFLSAPASVADARGR